MLPAGVNTAVWGGLAVLYLLLLVTLGLTGLRKGHWVLFILGFGLPLFWLIGAVMTPVSSSTHHEDR